MPGDQPNKGETLVTLVRLHIVSIEVPIGMASGSDEIWNHLDEQATHDIHKPALEVNGVRAGVGSEADWPSLAETLKQMTGRRLQESAAIILPGNPMSIAMKIEQPNETIFMLDLSGTLTGMDYPAGDRLLTVACTLNEDDPTQVMITAVPQARSAKRHTKFEQREGQLLMVAEPETASLSPLLIQCMVPTNDFLLIGPGGESSRPSSAGKAFFVKQREGMEFESLLILRPEVFATPVRTPPAGMLP